MPWIHAIVGSALILLSTLASQWHVYRTQNEIDGANAACDAKRRDLDQSENFEDSAFIVSYLGNIMHTQRAAISDARVRAADDVLLVRMEMFGVIRLSRAAGPGTFDYSIVAPLEEKAQRGELLAALDEIKDLKHKHLSEAFQYRQQLESEIATLEKRIHGLEVRRNRLSLGALLLQVTGLVLLLLKEVPTASASVIDHVEALPPSQD